LHCDGDALFRVQVLLWSHVEGHQFQRKFAAVFDHREDDRAVAFHHACPATGITHRRLMRACLAVRPSQHAEKEHDRQYSEPCDNPDFHPSDAAEHISSCASRNSGFEFLVSSFGWALVLRCFCTRETWNSKLQNSVSVSGDLVCCDLLCIPETRNLKLGRHHPVRPAPYPCPADLACSSPAISSQRRT